MELVSYHVVPLSEFPSELWLGVRLVNVTLYDSVSLILKVMSGYAIGLYVLCPAVIVKSVITPSYLLLQVLGAWPMANDWFTEIAAAYSRREARVSIDRFLPKFLVSTMLIGR